MMVWSTDERLQLFSNLTEVNSLPVAGAAACVDAVGVSGPVQFDMFGDVVVHAESYVYGQFNLTMNKFVLTGFAS